MAVVHAVDSCQHFMPNMESLLVWYWLGKGCWSMLQVLAASFRR